MVSGATLHTSECLRCAYNEHSTCGYGFALLRAIFRHQATQRYGYHVTDITGCLRKSWYSKTATKPDVSYPSDASYVFLGTLIHRLLEQRDHRSWSEVPVKAVFDGIELVGTVDVYYLDGRIEDFKTTTIYREKLPYTDHAQQVNVYAVLLQTMGLPVQRAFIQYIDKTGMPRCPICRQRGLRAGNPFTCSVCGAAIARGNPGTTKTGKPRALLHAGAWRVEIALDKQHTERFIRRRLTALHAAVSSGVPPGGEASFLCHYCPWKERCPAA